MKIQTKPKIGVIIVSFCSADVIGECLTSLFASSDANLSIVLCDNASPDRSVEKIREIAAAGGQELREIQRADLPEKDAKGPLTLIHAGENLGYAGGVNLGLEYLMKAEGIDDFWVLNPDSVVEPDTARHYGDMIAKCGNYGLMGGRTLYFGENGMIQSDGGLVNMWTGICSNANVGQNVEGTEMPAAEELDFMSGANLVASRRFVEQVGPMREGYFLYYEEVDWALRRGDLPLITCPDAVIYHHAGTAIGSGTTRRRPSAFANYFNYRNRVWFIRNFRPMAAPVAYFYSFLKIVRLLTVGAFDEAEGAWRGLNNLKPPRAVAARIDKNAHKYAFGARPK